MVVLGYQFEIVRLVMFFPPAALGWYGLMSLSLMNYIYENNGSLDPRTYDRKIKTEQEATYLTTQNRLVLEVEDILL